jgi:nitronate monooxygenase
LKNKFTEEWAHRETEAAAVRGSLATAYAEARARQDLDMLVTVAGEATGLLHDRPSAASIVEGIVTQAEFLLKRGASADFTTVS